MISFQFTCTNKNGDTVTFNNHTDPNNVYALQAYPKFVRNIKNAEVERQGQNNFWDFFSYNGRMTVSFAGVVIADTHQHLEQMRAALMRVFAIPLQSSTANDGYVTITWTDDDGIAKQVEAKIIQDIAFERRLARRTVMDFQIQLKAKNNYIASQGGYIGIVSGQRGYLTNGLTLPTLASITTAKTYVNKLTVSPTVSALPQFVLYGEAQQLITHPSIYNATTGKTFKVNVSLNGASDYITINTENGTVTNAAGLDVSAYIDIGSTFITLKAGANDLVYLSDQDPLISGIEPEAGTHFTISYKNIYLS